MKRVALFCLILVVAIALTRDASAFRGGGSFRVKTIEFLYALGTNSISSLSRQGG